MKSINKARDNFLKIEENYSKYASKSSDSIRLNPFIDDYRASYFRDVDRIINALSYNRYAGKTQVYPFVKNDHVSERMIHVQLVSKIARSIGRALSLNTDLIEAIALGHDIGHTPLGHYGESLLNEISLKELNDYFAHNIQSVRHYMIVENNGKGINLSVQVLDGIMCHNGEMVSNKYTPINKSREQFLIDYNNSYKDIEKSRKISPMTLEGCVVRISDIIGYIGRDIEDAINLGLFDRSDIPKEISSVLGNTNKDIVNTIVIDIIDNSIDKPYIKMSDSVYKALVNLKKFNYKNIYNKSITDNEKNFYKEGMNNIYYKYLDDINNNNKDSIIYKIFLDGQDSDYIENTSPKRIVIDFIAGMTDELFLNEIKKVTKI